ncbi:MAG: LppP/LprE family lipoprotein [Crocosphaera sp.]
MIEVISKIPTKQRTKIWLDNELKNWNKIGQMIPNAPKIDADPPSIDRCKEQVREAKTPQERSIFKAGWELFGPRQTYDQTTVITAMSGVDGMCRPLGYQAFVFVEEQFAGTLSPQAMNSRTDGDISRILLTSSSNLFVEYKRYNESDALCCASGMSRVSFKIEPRDAKPLLIPVEAVTKDQE